MLVWPFELFKRSSTGEASFAARKWGLKNRRSGADGAGVANFPVCWGGSEELAYADSLAPKS